MQWIIYSLSKRVGKWNFNEKMEKQWFWHEIYLFMLNSSKNLFQPSYFPKFSNCHTLGIKKSRQWAILKNLISRAWKNSAHALQPKSFNSCQGWYRGWFMETRLNFMPGMKIWISCRAWNRMISRLLYGNEVAFHARHENINFIPVSCPAWNRVISRLLHGNEVAFHARHENLNFMPGMKSVETQIHAGHENIFLADFKPGRAWI